MSEAVNNAPETATGAAVVPVGQEPAPVVEQAEPDDFDSFHEQESKQQRKAEPAPATPKPAAGKQAQADEPDPEPAPEKPKHQPKPDAEKRIQQLARENRELKSRLEASQPKPAETPAPAKAAEPAKPDPKPRMADFEDIEKWEEAKDEWYEREADRRAEAAVTKALTERDSKAEKAKATTEAQKHQEVLNAAREAIEAEFSDWSDLVLGTEEADGIAARLSRDVQDWCDSDPDVSFRGLYELAKLPEAEQEAFFKLNNVRKVAKLVQLGEKKSAPAPVVVPGAGRRAAPPPRTVATNASPSVDIESSDDFDAVHEHWRAQEMAKRIRR